MIPIFGIGTGRCGSKSLAVFLNQQTGAYITHERFKSDITWGQNRENIDEIVRSCDYRYCGDVAMYWLPHVEYMLERYEAKVICMKRDKGDTINSFVRKTPFRNHWQEHDGVYWQRCTWDKCFPNYKADSKEEALTMYWDEYYHTVNAIEKRFANNMLVVSLEEFNAEEGRRRILDFIGIDRKEQIVDVNAHVNKHQYPVKKYVMRQLSQIKRIVGL